MKYLSGIQLGFADGTTSTMIEAEDAINDELKMIEIDPSRTIRAISMKLIYGRNIEGLRLYDHEMSLIVDITWDIDENKDGEWSDLQYIPLG